ncbi:MAG: hypothetical protein AMJ75_09895 [Phycisphaerae bacterium SM1_79]|nr:MAG: hypothetical protein AMJ75_09895 [Phycisphaerae bacterium SM1_79]
MRTRPQQTEPFSEPLKTTFKKFCIVVVFSIAFGYIEAAVVVYLREIFHPDGFTFPMTVFGDGPHWKRFLLTEIGREAATIVLIFTGAWLFGRNRQQRFAYFLVIFAVWDIFYYVWLKVLINWPASIMDWDILFLIPGTWASPVLYPVLVAITLLVFAGIILYRSSCGRAIQATLLDWLAFVASALIVVASFYIAGLHITEQDFASYFYSPLFAAGYLLGVAMFLKCVLRSKQKVCVRANVI